jgi:hypothetical protein
MVAINQLPELHAPFCQGEKVSIMELQLGIEQSNQKQTTQTSLSLESGNGNNVMISVGTITENR